MSIPKGVYEDVFRNMNELSLKLDQYEKERNQLDQMREEWISNVSHDMKTPLASIHGYTELMKDNATELTPQELYEFTSIINRQSVYMKDLLDDLNLTMRLRNQRLPLQFEDVDIVGFIREMTIELLNDSQFGDRQVEFEANVDKATHKVDKNLLKRAIFNFIYNALVHNDENVVVKYKLMIFIYNQNIIPKLPLPIMAAVFPPKIWNRFLNATIEVRILPVHMGPV